MQMLKAKLYLLKQQENAEKLSDIRGDVKDIGLGKPDPFLRYAAVHASSRITGRTLKMAM